MNIKQPKFSPGQKVYINTKQGLELKSVESVNIRIDEYLDQSNRYYFSLDEGYTGYNEDQILSDFKQAKAKLKQNEQQLTLTLPA